MCPFPRDMRRGIPMIPTNVRLANIYSTEQRPRRYDRVDGTWRDNQRRSFDWGADLDWGSHISVPRMPGPARVLSRALVGMGNPDGYRIGVRRNGAWSPNPGGMKLRSALAGTGVAPKARRSQIAKRNGAWSPR